jgi:hypothetical protein
MADYFDADLAGSRFERVDLSGSQDLQRGIRAIRRDPREYRTIHNGL